MTYLFENPYNHTLTILTEKGKVRKLIAKQRFEGSSHYFQYVKMGYLQFIESKSKTLKINLNK